MTTELMQFLLPYFENLYWDLISLLSVYWFGVFVYQSRILKYLFVHTKVQSDRVSENNAIKRCWEAIYF